MLELDAEERNKIIGENLRKYRLLKGLTQDELAEGICSVSQLSKAENGKTYIKRTLLRQMADRLGVTVERVETTDALFEELKETLQYARDARAAGNLEKALEMVISVVEKSQEFGYSELMFDGLLLECVLHSSVQQYDRVIEKINEQFDQGNLTDPTRKVQFWLELGRAHELNGNIVAAYHNYCKADDEFEYIDGQLDVRLNIMYSLAKGHYWMRNDRTALRYTEKAEKLAKELSKYLWRIRATYTKAAILERLGEVEKAERIYWSVLKEAEDNSLLFDVGLIHNNYGELLKKRGDYAQASTNFQRARKVYELLNEEVYLCSTLLHLSELSIEEGDLQKATEYIEHVLAITDRHSTKTFQKKAKALHVLGKVKGIQGDFEAFVSHLENALEIFDQHHVVLESYDVAVELAEKLYEQGDPRAVEMYRRAIEYQKRSLEFGRRR